MVAADQADASQAGATILAAGGNAFDAAIAVSLTLTVTRPASTGIGGGGFLLAYDARRGEFVALDFRETAPRAATPERYAELARMRGDGPSASIYGGNAVGVPGLLAGLGELQRRFGTKPWSELAEPAIRVAEKGFAIDEHHRSTMVETKREIERYASLRPIARVLRERLGLDGGLPAVGALCKRPDLAETLRTIGRDGIDAFYHGAIADEIVAAVGAAGGSMTLDDMREYRVRELKPLRSRYRDFEIVGMPPPSSGGVAIAEMLNILDLAGNADPTQRAEVFPHVFVEAMKHAFADRARFLGDPDFCKVPVEQLIGRSYAAELAKRISPTATLPSERYGSPAGAESRPAEDRGTSHFCVADRFGNVVAMTETINGTFGSLVMTERTGILLNNQMDDFLTVRGEANLFGLTQSEGNLVGPGKRPLSSMSPTIVTRDGRIVLAIGGSGGPRIISAVAQVTWRVLGGELLLDAMEMPRVHHQWQPDEVYFDREPPADWLAALRRVGHKVAERKRGAAVQAIQQLPNGEWIGACDPRKGGRPAAGN